MGSIQFQPERWHACHEADWLSCENGVNCYSYILDRPEYFWSVPGEGFIKAKAKQYFQSFDHNFKHISITDFCKSLIRGAINDGLILVDAAHDKEGNYLAALFFADGEKDFHWYRKDDDGYWSHKNGREAASNLDGSGARIENPLNVRDARYPVFGGFFLVPRDGVTLTKQFPLVS